MSTLVLRFPLNSFRLIDPIRVELFSQLEIKETTIQVLANSSSFRLLTLFYDGGKKYLRCREDLNIQFLILIKRNQRIKSFQASIQFTLFV